MVLLPVSISISWAVVIALVLTILAATAWLIVGRWGAWLALCLLVRGAVGNTLHTFGRGRHSGHFARIMSEEYAAAGESGLRRDPDFATIAIIRTLVRRTVGVRVGGDSSLRWRHARRWARLRESLVLGRGLALWFASAVLLGSLLWSHELIINSEDPSSWCEGCRPNFVTAWCEGCTTDPMTEVILIEMNDVALSLASGVPFLDLPNTFGWDRPGAFRDQPGQNLLLLGLKLVVLVPITKYLFTAFGRSEIQDVSLAPILDPVTASVASAQEDHGLELGHASPDERNLVMQDAADRLNALAEEHAKWPWSSTGVAMQLRADRRIDRGTRIRGRRRGARAQN